VGQGSKILVLIRRLRTINGWGQGEIIFALRSESPKPLIPLRWLRQCRSSRCGMCHWDEESELLGVLEVILFQDDHSNCFNITFIILNNIHRPAFYLKHDILDIGFCLRLRLEPTQVDPIDRAIACLQRQTSSRSFNALKHISIQ
jgi:hypothetical protein